MFFDIIFIIDRAELVRQIAAGAFSLWRLGQLVFSIFFMPAKIREENYEEIRNLLGNMMRNRDKNWKVIMYEMKLRANY